MKRLTLLTILLVVVGLTAGFAIDVKPTFSLSGSATVKWGVDLITLDHGFTNTADASFTMTLIPKDSTETKGAKADWYGSITFANLELYWTDAGVPVFGPADADISAKIVGMGGNLAIGIFGKPSLKYEYAGWVPLFASDAGYATVGALTPTTTITGGLKIDYTIAGFGTLTAKFASNGDWGVTAAAAAATTYTVIVGDGVTDPTLAPAGTVYLDPITGLPTGDNPLVLGAVYIKAVTAAATGGSGNNQYSFGGDFSLTAVKDLTLAAGAFYNLETAYLGFGAKAGYTIAGVSANVGFDGRVVASVFSYDLAGSIAYSFMKDKDSISVNVYNDNVTGANGDLDVGLLFKDAEGFVPGLSFTLGAYANDLLFTPAHDPMWIAIAQSASYKFMLGDVNYVKPYEKVLYDMHATPAQLYLNVGVEAVLIPNTTFTVDFAGGKIANDSNVSLVTTDISAYQVLTFAAKVSY